mmetsp:Transcript_29655/g.84824  ORF Transcript_29655/g.84824 Transcript_29655/m.84824 type:complete len:227 (+) Transcript_29655:501-1181(+)
MSQGDALHVEHGHEARDALNAREALSLRRCCSYVLSLLQQRLADYNVRLSHRFAPRLRGHVQRLHVPSSHGFDHDSAALPVLSRKAVAQQSPVPSLRSRSPRRLQDAVDSLPRPPPEDVAQPRIRRLDVVARGRAAPLQQPLRNVEEAGALHPAPEPGDRQRVGLRQDLDVQAVADRGRLELAVDPSRRRLRAAIRGRSALAAEAEEGGRAREGDDVRGCKQSCHS